MSEYQLSVIIAVQYAQRNLNEIIRRLRPENHLDVEFLFCATADDPETLSLVSGFENVSVLISPAGSLIPELWKEGIRSARGPALALSTAHCLPANNWVQCMLDEELTDTAAVGGVISNDPNANAMSWAVYLLRYISFSPPRSAAVVGEIAADNALYSRERIMDNADLLEAGFWEPSFHLRFHAAGCSLRFNPDIEVVHKNCYSTGQFFRQRLAHGKAFGMARVETITPLKRWMLIILTPVLPLVFLSKIIARVFKNKRYLLKLVTATPWLLLFLIAWGLGELTGYLASRDESS